MNALCIDDEPIVLQLTTDVCRESGCFSAVTGLVKSEDVLPFLASNQVDFLFMDINMPGRNGLSLAQEIKEKYPHIALIFITGYSEYALPAFQMHVDGYLTKPVSVADIKNEVAHVELQKKRFQPAAEIMIQTFGNFEIYVKGVPVKFDRKRAKEILAYLVDKRGTGVTRAELASIMWEDELYDHSKQKQLDVFIQSLKKTLTAYNALSIFEMEKGELRVNPKAFQCDFYDLLEGKKEAYQAYYDSYMNAYSWAEGTKAYLTMKIYQNK